MRSGCGRIAAVCFMLMLLPSLAVAAPVNIVSFGAKCDGVTDDAGAIKQALKASGAHCTIQNDQDAWNQGYIVLPAGRTCVVKSPLTVVGSCVGIRGDGAVLDFRALRTGASNQPVSALTVISAHPASPYGDNVVTWDGVHLVGPGPQTNTIGLRVGTGQAVFDRLNINSFGVGIQLSESAYVDQFDHPNIFRVGKGVECPPGLKNAGENITINQGSIFNSGIGIDNQGCGFIVNGTSFDGLAASTIVNGTHGGGSVRCANCYIEYFKPIAAPIFDLGGCNAWEYIDFQGGTVQNDHSGSNVLALIRNDPKSLCGGSGPWAYFNDVFFGNLNPTSKCNAGSGPTCVMGRNAQQVRVERSTNGAGGGTMWNVRMHSHEPWYY
jgi:hypothetical protein